MTSFLSDDDQARYRDNGYLYPVPVMSEADAAAHLQQLEEIEADEKRVTNRAEQLGIVAPVGMEFQ